MKQNDGNPILFAEWSPLKEAMLKRRDFRLDHMLEAQDNMVQLTLFDESSAYECNERGELVLKPVKEFPPIHYRRVQEHD